MSSFIELSFYLPTKAYTNEDIPAKMKLSPVQIMMFSIPNRGKKTIMKEKNRVTIHATNIHPQPLIFSEDICRDSAI